MGMCSPLADIAAEHRLQVDDRRAVQRFEVAHPDSAALDGSDLHPVQPDRIGSVLRAGAEYALLRPRGIAARVYPQDVAACTIEPGEDDDLIPYLDAVEGLEHRRLEDEPRARRALVALLGGGRRIGQR